MTSSLLTLLLSGLLAAGSSDADHRDRDVGAPVSGGGDRVRAAVATEPDHGDPARAAGAVAQVRWRRSVAIGLPEAGGLEAGVRLPREGRHFFTWDPIRRTTPNRTWRRWGTDDLVRTVLRVAREHAAAHPRAPRLGIGDLSRPQGGSFGAEYGGIGHATHQNGLDVDVYYPRLDDAERPPLSAGEIDPRLSQSLVDRFVAAGAVTVFVGPNTGLTGPPDIVIPLVNHDNHLHARFAFGGPG